MCGYHRYGKTELFYFKSNLHLLLISSSAFCCECIPGYAFSGVYCVQHAHCNCTDETGVIREVSRLTDSLETG